MSRIRYLKPSFFLDDALSELGPFERLTFAGLWCIADREGRLEDSAKRLKVQILPYDDVNMEKILSCLNPHFIIRYAAAGKRYIQIKNFLKHQKPHYKEVKSVIPPPPKGVQVSEPEAEEFELPSEPVGQLPELKTFGKGGTPKLSEDFTQYRLPPGFGKDGKYGGVLVANLPADEASFLLAKMPRLGNKIKRALAWRVDLKNGEMSTAQRKAVGA